jgi:hypothetical protein
MSPELLADVIAQACVRLPALRQAVKADRIGRPAEVGAWTDAALALIELELPAWGVRRLAYEDGEWFCSLSCHLNMPADLDDTADAIHPVLALAILIAFVEARRRTGPASEYTSRRRRVQPHLCFPVCCEDFA